MQQQQSNIRVTPEQVETAVARCEFRVVQPMGTTSTSTVRIDA